MAKTGKTAGKTRTRRKSRQSRNQGWLGRQIRRACLWALRAAAAAGVLILALVVVYAFVNPPLTHTIWSEYRRLGSVERAWVPIERMTPDMARSVVAAEDANFCLHWGFDVAAIRDAIEDGSGRGASTLTQQVVKNVFLWQGRSWVRKALETAITPVVELVWSKRRILEVYLNLAEMGEGVFGAEAAAQHWFGVGSADLSAAQAARIAAILPNPRGRSAKSPSTFVRKRTAAIIDGAATIRADGRVTCFED